MAVCPSDGFVDRDMKNIEGYLFHSQEIILNCPLAESRGYEIPCLGMLDSDAWTTLMILAETKEIKILTGDCSSCEDKQAGVVSETILQEIIQLWPNHPQIIREVLPARENSYDSIDKNSTKITGNAGRVSLRQQGRDKLKALFPALEAEEVYPVPRTRQWLAQAIGRNSEKKVPYQALSAKESCTGCEICVKICPQGALNLVPKDGNKLLIYEPLKCVQCGRCVETCGPKALGFDYMSFSSRFLTGKILLIESEPKYCNQCGKQLFYHNETGLCIACASRNPDTISQMSEA